MTNVINPASSSLDLPAGAVLTYLDDSWCWVLAHDIIEAKDSDVIDALLQQLAEVQSGRSSG